ncbi:MAG: DinB family protein [Planctomycetia bacterium]|nr:DinB family protein [Planctomycetia bacterium]
MTDSFEEVDFRNETIKRLSATLGAILSLSEEVTERQSAWSSSESSWSLREILGHLIDADREIFRIRLDLLLRDPAEEWPSMDPEKWVGERKYSERTLGELLRIFQDERQRSLAWLVSIEDPDWHQGKDISGGPIRAGDLLLAWCSHDLAHVEQICRWRTQSALENRAPFDDDFAY